MATSFGQRRALGRRYSQDPALMLELERLEKEYSLIPSREARALERERMAQQESQFSRGLAQQADAQQQAATAGMIGTVGNLAIGAPMAYYAGKSAGLWGAPAAQTMANIVTPSVGQSANTVMAGMSTGTTGALGYQPFTVNPATVDAAATGTGIGSTAAASYGSQGGIGTGIGAMESGIGATAANAAPYLAAYTGMRMAGSVLEEQPWAPREVADIVKHPLTGAPNQLLQGAGKLTGIKELNQLGENLVKAEDKVVELITAPFKAAESFLSSVFGW